jgi:hypothetical protein
MADFQLNVKINGIEQTLQSVGDLERALQATNDQLKGVESNSREFSFLTNQANNISTVFNAVTESATGFSDSLNSVNQSAQKLGDTITNGANISSELNSAGASATNLSDDIKGAAKSGTGLRTELRKITQELQGLEPGSVRFQELSIRAGELRDQIADTSAVINSLAGSSTERLGKALSSTTQIGIAGFQGITAGAALFGVEGEALQETMVKLQALLNLSQAVETFGGLGDRLTEIKAGFSSLFGAASTATNAINASVVATTAEGVAAGAAATATTANAVANNANAIANQADAAASLEDAAAKGIEAAATEVATGATTALGIAMKALPIVAIAAAIGTLVYSIYQYTSANSEAAKAEEKREKELLALKKAEEEQATAVGKESGEFVKLIYQLKTTNTNSLERKKLIKEINDTYGTTFQNLQDETAFQGQLNIAVEDYINLQYNKFKLAKADEEFQKVAAKRFDAEQKQARLMAEFEKDRYKKGERGRLDMPGQMIKDNYLFTTDETLGNYRRRMGLFDEQMRDVEKTLSSAETSMNSLGLSAQDLQEKISDITKSGTKYVTQTNNNTKVNNNLSTSIKELTALEQYRNEIADETIKFTNNQAISSTKKTQSLIDDLDLELKMELQSAEKRYNDAIKKDTDEVTSKKKKTSEKQSIDKLYTDFTDKLSAEYQVRIKKQNEEELKAYQVLYDELKVQNGILQEEIRFGDQNTADTKAQLAQRVLQSQIDQIDAEIKNNQLSLEDYDRLLAAKAAKQQEYYDNESKIAIRDAEANVRKEILNYKKSLEEKLQTTITFNERGDKVYFNNLKRRSDEEEKLYQDRLVAEGVLRGKQEGETEDRYRLRLKNEVAALENIIKTKENLEEEYAQNVVDINKKKNDSITKSDVESVEMSAEKRLDILKKFFAIAQDNLSILAQGTNIAFATTIQSTLTAIQGLVELSGKEFDTTAEKVAAYAQVIGQAINSVVNAFVEQNQAALEQDLQNFQITNNAEKDALTERYNKGLIDKQTYDAGITASDKKLKASELAAKKKAFEEDKKLRIVQATIAGLTGAVSAFAGAMTIPPPAGPIIGGILAAVVAATTAINISQIKKQQFDSGGTTVDVSSTQVGGETATQINAASSGGFTSFNEGVVGSPTGTTTTTGATTGMYQKVYVLESDITNSQNRVRTLESNASFG